MNLLIGRINNVLFLGVVEDVDDGLAAERAEECSLFLLVGGVEGKHLSVGSTRDYLGHVEDCIIYQK